MLLGKKTKPSIESEWAVILERSPHEFARNRAVDKLSQVFSISADESRDLIDNTPIILLDHLSLEVAEKVKEFFSEANVNCSLTNDTFTKRKCFRAVWPEQPSLSTFLGEAATTAINGDFEKPTRPTLPEVSHPSEFVSSVTSDFTPQTSFTPSVDEDERRLKELALDLQKENEMLRLKLEKVEDSVKERERERHSTELEGLQSERIKLENEIQIFQSENRALVSRIEELERELKGISASRFQVEELKRALHQTQENSIPKSQYIELKAQFDQLQADVAKIQNATRMAQSESKYYQNEWIQSREALAAARNEIDELKHKLSQAEDNTLAKSQLTELRTQLEHFRSEFARVQNAVRLAQSESKHYQSEWIQAQKVLSEARSEVEELKRMLNQTQADSIQVREEAERIRLEAEQKLQTHNSEVDEWKRRANDWSASYFKVMKENEFLRTHRNEEIENLKERNEQMSAQLEQAQRQIKDFTTQLEQQELIQKRTKLAADLAEQESRLKGLVEKQRTLESEIRLREQELKSVLSEQQLVEDEIVKAKQTQKYLVEQAKLREKSRFTRPKTSGQNPGFIAPPVE